MSSEHTRFKQYMPPFVFPSTSLTRLGPCSLHHSVNVDLEEMTYGLATFLAKDETEWSSWTCVRRSFQACTARIWVIECCSQCDLSVVQREMFKPGEQDQGLRSESEVCELQLDEMWKLYNQGLHFFWRWRLSACRRFGCASFDINERSPKGYGLLLCKLRTYLCGIGR